MPRKAKPLAAIEVSRLTEAGYHAVGTVAGLNLWIKPTGARAWILRVRVGGKRREIGLGGYPDVPLAEAHRKAREKRAGIEQGLDPVLERKTARSTLIAAQTSAITFDRAVDLFLDAKGDEFSNAKHLAQWRATLKNHASPVIGSMIVSDVGSSHVLTVLEPVWKVKTETASRLRGRIESVLSYAMQAGYAPKGLNPARWKDNLDKVLAKPSKIAEVEHFPALPYDEMGRFIPALRATLTLTARCLELAILCGVRSGEARGATYSEFDLHEKLWTIPAARTKKKREHRVPLSPAAIYLLTNLPRIAGTDLLFPSPRSKVLSDATLGALIGRMHEVDVRAGGIGFTDPKRDNRVATAHGFRSTFRDWASERTAFSGETVEMALAHVVKDKTEAAYRRGDQFEKRQRLMDEWAVFCSLPSPVKGRVDNVVRIQAG